MKTNKDVATDIPAAAEAAGKNGLFFHDEDVTPLSTAPAPAAAAAVVDITIIQNETAEAVLANNDPLLSRMDQQIIAGNDTSDDQKVISHDLLGDFDTLTTKPAVSSSSSSGNIPNHSAAVANNHNNSNFSSSNDPFVDLLSPPVEKVATTSTSSATISHNDGVAYESHLSSEPSIVSTKKNDGMEGPPDLLMNISLTNPNKLSTKEDDEHNLEETHPIEENSSQSITSHLLADEKTAPNSIDDDSKDVCAAATATTAVSTTESIPLSPPQQPPPESMNSIAVTAEHPMNDNTMTDNEKDETSGKTISALEQELLQAKALIQSLQVQIAHTVVGNDGRSDADEESNLDGNDSHVNNKKNNDDFQSSILESLQAKLEAEIVLRAEAENKTRIMTKRLQELETENQLQAEEIANIEDVQKEIHIHEASRSRTEEQLRDAYERIQKMEEEMEQKDFEIRNLSRQVVEAREANAVQEQGMEIIRQERDEQARRETALMTRLNAAKKKEAGKTTEAETLEESLIATKAELEMFISELKQMNGAKTSLEQELEQLKKSSEDRIDHYEKILGEERKLSEERKAKMKTFIEKKAEELRQAKEDNDSLQTELAQTNRSLVELNNRWKQLHTQWVQAQSRNRELQRDLNRIKKDSETLHKQGDTLEMKLSRSANETEEHKNKRLAAKHELMSVLRALDAERDALAKIRDKLKFTFTPKILNQKQTLKEGLDEFEASLQKLSLRLGKPVPHLPDQSEDHDNYDHSASGTDDSESSDGNEINALLRKLENETDRVSEAVSAMSTNIERLRTVLDTSGDRTCITVLSELVTGAVSRSPALQEERTAMTGSGITSRARYGQVGHSAETL